MLAGWLAGTPGRVVMIHVQSYNDSYAGSSPAFGLSCQAREAKDLPLDCAISRGFGGDQSSVARGVPGSSPFQQGARTCGGAGGARASLATMDSVSNCSGSRTKNKTTEPFLTRKSKDLQIALPGPAKGARLARRARVISHTRGEEKSRVAGCHSAAATPSVVLAGSWPGETLPGLCSQTLYGSAAPTWN